jgi:hypothetical protein
MWNLITNNGEKRLYRNTLTGSEVSTSMVYEDEQKNKWWSFDNLFTLPFMRQFAATKISSLYQIGLSKDDLTNFIQVMRTTLKLVDPEKYEKAFGYLLQFEEKVNDATNAIKQISSLVCVYNMLNDERIDIFDQQVQYEKMKILEVDLNAQSFFLTAQIQRTETYGNHCDYFSKIASALKKGTLAAMD